MNEDIKMKRKLDKDLKQFQKFAKQYLQKGMNNADIADRKSFLDLSG